MYLLDTLIKNVELSELLRFQNCGRRIMNLDCCYYYYYYSHFTDVKMEAQRLYILLNIT